MRSCSTIPTGQRPVTLKLADPARPARLSPDRDPEPRRQGFGQPRRLPGLSRLRRLGRCQRAGRLCELRAARRLRGPGEDGRRRQGQDRPRPLRRALPRPEGPQRPEARGEGNPDLLRPGRRRVRQGGRLSERPVPARFGHPARQRPVPLARAGRSLDAGRPVGQGGQAAAVRHRNGFTLSTDEIRPDRVPSRSLSSPTGRRRPA